jgi:hypothetical protein
MPLLHLTASQRERYDILDSDGMLFKETERVRHRIKAAFIKGVAPENSSCRQIYAFDHAMLFQSTDCIHRAGWVKSARLRQYRGQKSAINANEKNNELRAYIVNCFAVPVYTHHHSIIPLLQIMI